MMTFGIPNGYCLGLLLLIVYLIDFAKCLKPSEARMMLMETHVLLASNRIDELTYEELH